MVFFGRIMRLKFKAQIGFGGHKVGIKQFIPKKHFPTSRFSAISLDYYRFHRLVQQYQSACASSVFESNDKFTIRISSRTVAQFLRRRTLTSASFISKTCFATENLVVSQSQFSRTFAVGRAWVNRTSILPQEYQTKSRPLILSKL